MTCFLGMVFVAMAGATHAASPTGIEIITDDVTRFYEVHQAAGGRPSAGQLQRDYLDRATAGLRHLTQVRTSVTAERIAQAIATQPELYTNAMACMAALPRIRERLVVAFDKLLDLYPEAQKPPVTILVSRGKPLAIAGPGKGVQIALEAMCSEIAAKVLGGNIDDVTRLGQHHGVDYVDHTVGCLNVGDHDLSVIEHDRALAHIQILTLQRLEPIHRHDV